MGLRKLRKDFEKCYYLADDLLLPFMMTPIQVLPLSTQDYPV